jgi:S-adenosylmethionine:tRNA ribosyltransferase-isomerase
MQVSAFDFTLPPELIAQRPIRPRDHARLLHLPAAGAIADRGMLDLPALLRPGDLLLFNDTRVLPARLRGRRGEAAVEVTLHQPTGEGRWRAFARPARKCRLGDRLDFAEGFAAVVVDRLEAGEIELRFALAGEALLAKLRVHGEVPLPPYIKRPAGGDPDDPGDYQTLFAREDGAVAAPTAALHFTPRLMAGLAERGVDHAFLTLHVGAGTFLPVKAEDTADHRMHGERYRLEAPAIEAIGRARARGGRVVAVGTTVLRTLEAVAAEPGRLRPKSGETHLFITPGFRFQVADLLLTNFHLPRSTLMMLVAAFAGFERIHAAYRHAIEQGYRFFSYGDACLLERAAGAVEDRP